jgi:hypothetical protein
MSRPRQDIDFIAPSQIAANLIATTFCNACAEALLDAQADMLKGVETAVTELLRRRQEAIFDAQRVVAHMRKSSGYLKGATGMGLTGTATLGR